MWIALRLLLVLLVQTDNWSEQSASQTLQSDPRIKVDFYILKGQNLSEAYRNISNFGPADERGGRFAAYTKWSFDWTAVNEPYSVSCEIRVTLPQWENYKALSLSLRKTWQNYYKLLLEHEKIHTGYAIDACNELIKELADTTTDSSRLAAANNILGNLRAKDRELDDETKNGKLQGVDLRSLINAQSAN